MQYGICSLNCIPVRRDADDRSEMLTQLLFGDHFEIVEQRKKWSRIRIAFDFYEGWIDNKQYLSVSGEDYQTYAERPSLYLTDLVNFAETDEKQLIPLTMGADLKAAPLLKLDFDGRTSTGKLTKPELIALASNYLNAPYLWGGKTPFGIDCSGFVQMLYKMAGRQLLRDASQQARQGETLSFIEETEPGDLAFFDNDEGQIIHVGLILKNNHIIHAHGKVRIDRLDHTGIFNNEKNAYSHHLRVIKKIM